MLRKQLGEESPVTFLPFHLIRLLKSVCQFSMLFCGHWDPFGQNSNGFCLAFKWLQKSNRFACRVCLWMSVLNGQLWVQVGRIPCQTLFAHTSFPKRFPKQKWLPKGFQNFLHFCTYSLAFEIFSKVSNIWQRFFNVELQNWLWLTYFETPVLLIMEFITY